MLYLTNIFNNGLSFITYDIKYIQNTFYYLWILTRTVIKYNYDIFKLNLFNSTCLWCVCHLIYTQRKRTVQPGLRVCIYHMIILRYLDEFFFKLTGSNTKLSKDHVIPDITSRYIYYIISILCYMDKLKCYKHI